MAYVKKNWQNTPSTNTPINADNLNHMEQGIYDAAETADYAKDKVDDLQGLVYSPLVAATAAAMTDTTKVYVYTGSETGYTSGHWYYYNGTAWADGGVYNSTAFNTDATLSHQGEAADAKATGDAIGNLNNALTASDNYTQNELDEVVEPHYIAQLNDNTHNTSGKYVNWQNGNLGNNASYYCTDPIRVKKGTLYLTNTTFQHYAFYGLDGKFVAYPSANNDITYFSGQKNVVGFSDKTANKISFVAPNDGYVRLSSTNSNIGVVAIKTISDDTSSVSISASVTSTFFYPVGYIETQKSISDLDESVDGEIGEITHNMTRKHIASSNVLDPSTFVQGKYMTLNGTINNSSSYKYSGKISVSAGDSVNIGYSLTGEKGSVLYGQARFITAFDSNNTAVEAKGAEMTSTYTVPEGIEKIVVTVASDRPDSRFFVSRDGTTTFEAYYDYYAYYATKEFLKDIDSNLHCYLPSEICVAVGRTIELYNELVCLESSKYHIDWTCDIGADFARKWTVTGTAENVGNHTLTMNIYDDNLTLIKTLTTTVKVVADSIPDNTYVLPIGDSLTNSKSWLSEVQTLSNAKVSYVGTRGTQGGTYHHEGRSGVSAAWYNANSEYTFDSNYVGNPNVQGKSNPFWDGSKFSLSHYLTEQEAYLDGTPTAVQILLGTNGIALDPTTNVNNIVSLVDKIRTEYPTMPIFVCNTIYRSNQNGYYSTGGQGYTSASDFQYSADMKIMNLQNALEEALEDYTGVYLVPLSISMDREYDFGNVPVAVNPRLTTVTIDIPNESVHPQNAGYMQMADMMYSCYCAHLS